MKKLKTILVTILMILLMPLVQGLTYDVPVSTATRIYVPCFNATDGTPLGSSATLELWDAAGNNDVNNQAMTNVEAGLFYYSINLPLDLYSGWAVCPSGAVRTPVIVISSNKDNLPSDPADDSDIDAGIARVEAGIKGNETAYFIPTLADTNELQGDDYPASFAELIAAIKGNETTYWIPTLADTNELQGDNYPASFTQLITAIKGNETVYWIPTLADTNELQGDDYPASFAQVIAAVGGNGTIIIAAIKGNETTYFIPILGDTNELQGDDYPAEFGKVYDNVTAIITRGDAAWTTGAGGSGFTAENLTAIDARLNDSHNTGSWVSCSGFSTHSAADVYTQFTSGSNEDAFKATGFCSLTNATSIRNDIAGLNDVSTTDLDNEGTSPAELSAFEATLNNSMPDQVWDEVLTGATHNDPTSAGRRLRQLEAADILHTGTAQAGGNFNITLASTANSSNDFYNHNRIVLVAGTGLGQVRMIADYDGTTKVALLDINWTINPDSSTEYEVKADTTVHVTHFHDSTGVETQALDQIRETVGDNLTADHGSGAWGTADVSLMCLQADLIDVGVDQNTSLDNQNTLDTYIKEVNDTTQNLGNESDVYTYFISGSNEDQFKATGFATVSTLMEAIVGNSTKSLNQTLGDIWFIVYTAQSGAIANWSDKGITATDITNIVLGVVNETVNATYPGNSQGFGTRVYYIEVQP